MNTKCKACKQEIGKGGSCGRQPVVGFNQRWERVPFGQEVDYTEQMLACPGCNAGRAGYHHVYCSFEECPRCQGKIDECGCFYTRKKE